MAYERNDRDRDARDRGFFDRAGDEVRSWFGDEEAERRRRRDERYDERYDARGDYGRDAYPRGGYEDDYRGGQGGGDYGRSYAGAPRSNRDDAPDYPRGYPSGPSYDRDFGPRRAGYGDRAPYGGAEPARAMRDAYARGGYSGGGGRDDDHGHGDSYRQWRSEQIAGFDRDYDEYRRENRTRFQSEFATWRQNRQTQRDSLSQVKEHHEVVGSDGAHVGTVDHVRADHLLLSRNDPAAGGHHHAIPSSWIASVGDTVVLSKTAADAKREWQDREQRGGLFGGRGEEGDDAGGRTDLGRSFSGTYR